MIYQPEEILHSDCQIQKLIRLRSGDFRIYYRIKEGKIVILAVRHKKVSDKFLRRIGEKRRIYKKAKRID